MSHKLRKMITFPVLLAGLAAVVLAPPAEANRGSNPTTTTTQPGYVPPPQYGENPDVAVPDPYANPVIAPTVVPVDLPVAGDPGAGDAGDGDRLAPAPSDGTTVLDSTETRPAPQPTNDGGFMGGILSRTGAETLPLARAGLAVLALGMGLVALSRRRRVDAPLA
jgi:hypothetical protein